MTAQREHQLDQIAQRDADAIERRDKANMHRFDALTKIELSIEALKHARRLIAGEVSGLYNTAQQAIESAETYCIEADDEWRAARRLEGDQ